MATGLGERLREARKLRRLTQVELATKSKVAQNTISDLETGESQEISGPVLIGLSAALEVRPAWLFKGAEPKAEAQSAPDDLKDDELKAIRALRGALPDWRRYVLGLAMITDKQRQQLFLDMMAPPVPDEAVSAAYGKPGKKRP